MKISVCGQVQGIGFRPFVARLAGELKLKGTVRNTLDGAEIHLEGSKSLLDDFKVKFRDNLPSKARIDSEKFFFSNPESGNIYSGFFIEKSISENSYAENSRVSAPVDLAICEDCEKEFNDPSNRRYLYPLISCTQCGPRYSITLKLPFDRKHTSLNHWELCRKCQHEYENPLNRRFHSQTIGCHNCGPEVIMYRKEEKRWLRIDKNNSDKSEISSKLFISKFIQEKINSGKILLLKGLGGYQLICDAKNQSAIQRIRKFKNRPNQSLALMVKDLITSEKLIYLNTISINKLNSPERPILISKTKENSLIDSSLISPDSETLGVMLPSTALHKLLFSDKTPVIVVTSGNKKSEPQACDLNEAIDNLGDIADFIIDINRDIINRCDDSIYRSTGSGVQAWRSARGITPSVFKLVSGRKDKNILSLGADLKSTVSYTDKGKVYSGPHLGSLQDFESLNYFENYIFKLLEDKVIKPDIITCDLHPGYYSSELAKNLSENLNISLIKIQHHVSHGASVMLENNLEECLSVICDGTGFGEDGNLWGGEFLYLNRGHYTRLATLDSSPLVSKEESIRNPYQQLLEFLTEKNIIDRFPADEEFIRHKKVLLKKLLTKSIRTTSFGRFFDITSALLGLSKNPIEYEGQAAILLEKSAWTHQNLMSDFHITPQKISTMIYPYSWSSDKGILIIQKTKIIESIIDDVLKGKNIDEIAWRFHLTAANMILKTIQGIRITRKKFSKLPVVLSGGVFQNALLVKMLTDLNFDQKIFFNRDVPPGDGGISLGQAQWASWMLEN